LLQAIWHQPPEAFDFSRRSDILDVIAPNSPEQAKRKLAAYFGVRANKINITKET
jgi:hypothetical protein